jgi:hypothetical protein
VKRPQASQGPKVRAADLAIIVARLVGCWGTLHAQEGMADGEGITVNLPDLGSEVVQAGQTGWPIMAFEVEGEGVDITRSRW